MLVVTNGGRIPLIAEARILGTHPQLNKRINYGLGVHVDEVAVDIFMNALMGDIQRWCANGGALSPIVQTEPSSDIMNSDDFDFYVERVVMNCSRTGTGEDQIWFRGLIEGIMSKLTLVESERALVYNIEKSPDLFSLDPKPFGPADDLLLVRRRRPNAPFCVLLVATLCVVGIRFLFRCFTRNDVERAIGLYVREFFGVSSMDTLLVPINLSASCYRGYADKCIDDDG